MFTELLARSCFSFLRGASHPEEMVERAKLLGLDAIALCDRDGLYGAARAWTRGKALEERVIVGAELSLPSAETRTASSPWSRPPRKKNQPGRPEPAVVALLAEDHDGYENLCRLLTRSHAGHPKGESALELEWLANHHRGLIAIVPAPRDPAAEDAPPAELFATLADVFGDRAFVAAHRHLDGLDAARIAAVRGWSQRFGLPVVASARPLFHEKSRKPLADVLWCIRNGTSLDRAGTAIDANAEAGLRSELELKKLFRDHPDWVDRAGEVGSALRFHMGELRYRFPCQLAPGESANEKLRRLTWQGAARRYPAGVPGGVRAQLEKELALIEKIDVAAYFLCTWEIVEIARAKKILCQGRGSAANSAVCYVLGITAVDPARSNLLFERFMSAERREPPDIDIDFEHERREEVIQEIYARYGRDRAAMVSEVICYRGKSALRETGKAFGLSLDQVDRLSATITHWDTAEVCDRRLAEMGFDVGDARLRQTVMLARTLQGFPRHLSIHVGGFVLSATPLEGVAPVEPARMPDRTVVPWDKDDLEDLGFFKVDVLGLGMLTAIRKCLALIHEGGALRAPAKERSQRDGETRRAGDFFVACEGRRGAGQHGVCVAGAACAQPEARGQVLEGRPSNARRTPPKNPTSRASAEACGSEVSKNETSRALGQPCGSEVSKNETLEGHASASTCACVHPRGRARVLEGPSSEPFDPLEVVTRIPPEEPEVYEMMSRADTVGVFQIESRAQMAMLPRLKPRRFYDLVIEVAIVRPGPIQGGMVHPYLRRRNGEEQVTVPHPDLWPILERTLGVPLFQEQVMQISIVGAGYTGGEADQLRRDMAAWKKTGRLLRHRDRLLDGFAAKGIDRAFGEALFEQIKGFGDYGFPESHAASFALLVYASSWQKRHYPAHFACALINSQPMGFYSPSTILQDAARHGVEVHDVDVTVSEWDCTLEPASAKSEAHGADRAIRLGFRVIKGFGEKPARRIEAARAEQELSSIDDLIQRARLNKGEIEALAESGALEPLVAGRRQALWKGRAPRVGGLFEKIELGEPEVSLPALRAAEQLVLDYGRKGLSVADHPLRHLRAALRERGVVAADELQELAHGRQVSVAGLVICRQQPGTASGVVFITLEDETGFSNLVLFRQVYEKLRLTARHSTLLVAHGRLERQPDLPAKSGKKVAARRVRKQREQKSEPPAVIHVIVEDLERLDVPGRDLPKMSRDFH